MATLDCKKINTQQFCGEEDHSSSTIKLTNKQHSFQIKPNCHLGLKSRPQVPPSFFHQQFNTLTQIGSCDSSTFTFTSSTTHKLVTETSSENTSTGNCWQPQDSESQYNEDDQSDNANASGKRAIKRKRVHKLSEKRRRDRINKRLRALRNLIPNCTKMDKADVVDEAIEYLKSLQLQLQIMPFCAGLCVPPTHMILPTQYPIIGAGALQLFGLPFAGYGTRLQMPMNALPVESPRR